MLLPLFHSHPSLDLQLEKEEKGCSGDTWWWWPNPALPLLEHPHSTVGAANFQLIWVAAPWIILHFAYPFCHFLPTCLCKMDQFSLLSFSAHYVNCYRAGSWTRWSLWVSTNSGYSMILCFKGMLPKHWWADKHLPSGEGIKALQEQ